MNLAVKFYKDMPDAPADMPKDWPALVIQDDQPGYGSLDDTWYCMTFEDYEEYRRANQGAYDVYAEKHLAAPGEPAPVVTGSSVYQRIKALIGV